MITRLNSIEEVIEALGGNREVAALTGRRSLHAVSMWKNRNSFPSSTLLIMRAALKARGKSAPSKLWGVPEAANV
jgi:hypothetical protein